MYLSRWKIQFYEGKRYGRCRPICENNSTHSEIVKFDCVESKSEEVWNLHAYDGRKEGRFDQPSRNKGKFERTPKSKLILPFCRVLITARHSSLERIADSLSPLMQNRLPKVAVQEEM